MGDEAVVVRRREDGATELRVNGVFVMDDVETSSERLLAEHVLDDGAREVLVGGLGLGYTARALLDGGATRVVVAELHPEVVRAVADGAGAGPFDDDRLSVVVGDVADVVTAQPPAGLDAICLDVDNGPDFLVHPANAALYETPMIERCARALRDDGVLAIWSMADSAPLRTALAGRFEHVEAAAVPVRLQGRDERYWVLSGRRPRR
ncbi:MAG: hypothetical protein QM621_12355 [Aeromicrobium sp.]|uniref:hypothetical protein n=1 Tax=Aeromicrobium sp. TaxID=1871063 RepID=UPI0039E33810